MLGCRRARWLSKGGTPEPREGWRWERRLGAPVALGLSAASGGGLHPPRGARGRDVKEAMSIPKRILRILAILAILYCCFVYYLYAAQDRMIFFPEKMTEERWTQVAEDLQGDYVTIEVSDKVGEGFGDEWEREAIHLQGWFIPDGSGEARPTIIYFGGNDERLHRLAYGLLEFPDNGINILLVDYRGYGLSGGQPGADTMRSDSEIVFDAAARHPLVDSGSIIAWGHSLGTGVATHLATVRPVEKVILLSPYTSMLELVQSTYWFIPVKLFLKHKLDTLALAPSIKQPALIIHGKLDQTIPPEHAERVAEAWGGEVDLRLLDSTGHDNLMSDQAILKTVIDHLTQ